MSQLVPLHYGFHYTHFSVHHFHLRSLHPTYILSSHFAQHELRDRSRGRYYTRRWLHMGYLGSIPFCRACEDDVAIGVMMQVYVWVSMCN